MMRPETSALVHVDLILRLRAWRTWLLIVTGLGQGVQYFAAPDRPLSAASYESLRWIGAGGWRVAGGVFVGYSLLLVAHRTRRFGHALGAVLYLMLMWSVALRGYWPSLSILAAGLNVGEFWFWQRTRQHRLDRS